MCYSAQVVQLARKLHRQLGIRLDYAEAEKLFFRRLDDPTVNISRGFEANFELPVTAQEQRIKAAIDEHRLRTASRLEMELFAQKTRLAGGERTLRDRPTKRAREEVRIAGNKIESVTAKLRDLRRTEHRAQDDRVFPQMYVGVVIRQDGDNVLTPMRYFCRPAGKPADYDKRFPGLYNARRDNLQKFWKEQFGHHHALMVADSFYENVPLHRTQHRELQADEAAQNVILQFTPNPPQCLLVACVWSRWSQAGQPDVRGFAAITDEPPADVAAAGHDRCIINLRPEHVEAWLTPATCGIPELEKILSDPAVSTFAHDALRAA